MRVLLWVIICLMMLSATSWGVAAPSLGGFTGLINIPTAESLGMGDFNVAAFAVEREGDSDHTLIAGNVGLVFGLEVGAAVYNPEDGHSNTLFNGKYCFMNEGTVRPQMAIGFNDVTNELDSTPYLVLSKSLSPPVEAFRREIFNPTLHVGIGDGRLDGLFGGISAGIGNVTTLMAEEDGEHFNAGIRIAVSPELLVHAAAIDGWDDFGFGFSYNRELY